MLVKTKRATEVHGLFIIVTHYHHLQHNRGLSVHESANKRHKARPNHVWQLRSTGATLAIWTVLFRPPVLIRKRVLDLIAAPPWALHSIMCCASCGAQVITSSKTSTAELNQAPFVEVTMKHLGTNCPFARSISDFMMTSFHMVSMCQIY